MIVVCQIWFYINAAGNNIIDCIYTWIVCLIGTCRENFEESENFHIKIQPCLDVWSPVELQRYFYNAIDPCIMACQKMMPKMEMVK
jgi:hypothetical protein